MTADWPSEDLEFVPHCPLCNGVERRLVVEGVEDNIFNSASGQWDYYSCAACKTIWLDPRPTEESIGSAYATYYTHQQRKPVVYEAGFLRLRRSLTNGYRNWRFGTTFEPASRVGALIRFLPSMRKLLDQEYRYLPKPSAVIATQPRLLDIGAGNGDFLKFACDIGWQTVGVEPDDSAAQVARDQGLDVRTGTIMSLPDDIELFDRATIVQVVEHLHDPLTTLKAIRKKLKPGGQLWLDTPNALSALFAEFGADWRGLEPPRHLFVPSWQAMESLLQQAGFTNVQFCVHTGVYAAMCAKSRAVAARRDPYSEPVLKRDRFVGAIRDMLFSGDIRAAEFVTLSATAREAD